MTYLDATQLGSFVIGVLIAGSGENIPEDYKLLGTALFAVVFLIATSLNSVKRGFFNHDTKRAVVTLLLELSNVFESKRGNIDDTAEATVHRLLLEGFDLSDYEIVQENDRAILRRKHSSEMPTL